MIFCSPFKPSITFRRGAVCRLYATPNFSGSTASRISQNITSQRASKRARRHVLLPRPIGLSISRGRPNPRPKTLAKLSPSFPSKRRSL